MNTSFLQCVSLYMTIQMSFRCKPFVTYCTQIRPWLDIFILSELSPV